MADERRNVVLVTVDSLRADHCGFGGYDEDTTPTLDAMADEGVVFENAVAPAPFTEQSIPPTFTGSYPVRDGSENTSLGESTRTHVEKHRSIVQDLSEAGYSTGGFSPNPHASRQFGLDRGFDTFRDFITGDRFTEVGQTMLSRLRDGDFVESLRLGTNMLGLDVPGFGNQSIPMRAYYAEVIDWTARATEPFFLWIFPLEVHSPYRPEREYRDVRLPKMLYLNLVRSSLVDRDPDEEETAQLRELYDGAIRSIDDSVAQLCADLSEYEPVVIVTSDHGEAFGEHGTYGHDDHLYGENVEVPLLISGTPRSDRISDPVSLRRLPAMIRRVATGTPVDWRDFTEPAVSTRVQDKKFGVRSRDVSYVASGNSSQLYERTDQPGEEQPVQEEPSPRILERASRTLLDRRERVEIASAADRVCTEGGV